MTVPPLDVYFPCCISASQRTFCNVVYQWPVWPCSQAFLPPSFGHLQYAKMKEEGLVKLSPFLQCCKLSKNRKWEGLGMRLGHSAFKFQELYKRFGESAVQLTCTCACWMCYGESFSMDYTCSNWYDNVMVKFRQQFTPRMASETIPDSKCDS